MLKKTLIATTCCVALVGCQTVQENPNTAIGAGAGAALGAALGTLVGGDDRRNALAGTGAEVERQGDQLLVTMPSQITFATNESRIQPQFYGVLDDVAATFNKYPESYIDVIGHTDSDGSDAYNQELSERRGCVANVVEIPVRHLRVGLV